jgi:hypothetical protein
MTIPPSNRFLADIVLSLNKNQTLEHSGMDSLEKCQDKNHFLSYPHPVTYNYNSRGFRDREWPDTIEELQNAIWCIGDSFTVGMGSPLEFTWPQMLEKITGRRCINVSMDGASNDWITRRAQQIINQIAPTHMVVLWSYLHRRELPDTKQSDEARRTYTKPYSVDIDDHINFVNCYTNLNNCLSTVKIYNAIVPKANADYYSFKDQIIKSWNKIKDSNWPCEPPTCQIEFESLLGVIQADFLKRAPDIVDLIKSPLVKLLQGKDQLLKLTNLDYARDGHHFDKMTSEFFVQKICENFDSKNL